MAEKLTSFLCSACAAAHGWSIPAGHQPTCWEDRCALCGEVGYGTAIRDYGRLRGEIERVVAQVNGSER